MKIKSAIKIIYLNLRRIILGAISTFIKKSLNLKLANDIKILFIRIDRIGDLVLSTPALRALKQAFPHSLLVVLASPSNKLLLLNNPYVDTVFVYDQKKGLSDKIGIIKQLRSYSFDLAVDPYPDYELRTALIALLSGAKKRIGYASYGREAFFNIEAPQIKKDQHFVDLTLGILKSLGIKANDKKPEIFLTEDEKKWARNWLKKGGAGGKPIVGIHPGGYYETQRWLPERFAAVANDFKKSGYLDVIMFGGPGDEGLVDRISSMVNEELLTYMANDLRRLAALLSCCRVLICNNSGPLHIAVAMGTPTISIMGPTKKDHWMPIGNIHKVLRMNNLPCIGCNLGYCKIKTHDCMRLITPPMVIDAAKNILQL